jgi:hypothetical protein
VKQEADTGLMPSNDEANNKFKTFEEVERRYVQAWACGQYE